MSTKSRQAGSTELPESDLHSSNNDARDALEANDARDALEPALSPVGNARRRFLLESGALTGSIAASRYAGAATAPNVAEAREAESAAHAGRTRTAHLLINHRDYAVDIEPLVTLL